MLQQVGLSTWLMKTIKISQTKYYRYLLLSDPRFTRLARLGQEYLVDMWCRTEEEKLQFIRHNQSKFLRVASRSEIDESIAAEGGPKAGKIYLPSSYTLSSRFMQLRYQDGMAIVARLGKPTFFITVICNPKWVEITSNLHEKQSHIDRPDLCCRVFQLKLQALIRILKSGTIFGDVVYLLYVIEFQKRGLPHAHIAMQVDNGGSLSCDDINHFVRATIPGPEEYDGRLREIVLKHMVHGPCGNKNINAPCMDNFKCSKAFPKPAEDNTYIDDRGYIHYRRFATSEVQLKNKGIINDQWIVPYNSSLLLFLDCHCNVEVASSVKIIKYFFKYIHKGPDMARVSIVPDVNQNDEIEDYVNSRYISASEAIWRLLEFDISARKPTVIALSVHLPANDMIVFKVGEEKEALEKNVSKLQLYFDRPKTSEFENLTYLDFYEHYNIEVKSSPQTIFKYSDEKHFLTKRVRGECVARMHWLSPTLGEVYYLRLLLSKFPTFSFNELMMFNGETYSNFQDAAYARGLLDDVKEFREALREAAGFKTGHGLRILFFNLIMSGAPTTVLWNEFQELLAKDFLEKYNYNLDRAINKALCHIDSMLRQHGKHTEDVGLPSPQDDS